MRLTAAGRSGFHSFIYDSSVSVSVGVRVGVRVRRGQGRGDPDRGGWCVVEKKKVIPVIEHPTVAIHNSWQWRVHSSFSGPRRDAPALQCHGATGGERQKSRKQMFRK